MVKVRRGYRSRNVEDRGRASGGGSMGLPMPQSRGGEAWLTLGTETGDPARCEGTFDFDIPATEIMPS